MVAVSRKDENNFGWELLVEVMTGFFAMDVPYYSRRRKNWAD